MQNKFKLLTLFMQLLYSLVIGSLSIILVIQFVFAGREFVPPIQGFINGYEWVLSILGSLSESWLQSLVAYINNRYSGVLALQSIWLPLFFFALVFILDFVRRAWHDAMLKLAVLEVVFAGTFILFGCIIGSLFPLDGPSWIQGLIAALPFMTMVIGFVLAGFIDQIGRGHWAVVRSRMQESPMGIIGILALFVVGFGSGAQLSLVLPIGAGLAALGILVFSIALVFVFGELRNKEYQFRTGLTILCAYFGVSLIYVLDWALR